MVKRAVSLMGEREIQPGNIKVGKSTPLINVVSSKNQECALVVMFGSI